MNIKVQRLVDQKSFTAQEVDNENYFFLYGAALIPTRSFTIMTVDISLWTAVVGPTLKDCMIL